MVATVASFLFLLSHAAGKLIGGSVLPHGDFALVPQLLPAGTSNRSEAENLHAASFSACGVAESFEPDVILLIAPHAIALTNDFAVYTSSKNGGTALVGGDTHDPDTPLIPFSVLTLGDQTFSNGLVDTLRAQGANVTALLAWADSEPAPLKWSEVVPLTFLANLTNVTTSTHAPPPVVVWTQPLRRYACSSCMVPELLRLGKEVFTFIESIPQRVWVVVSADLAHTHPAATNPYPANATAASMFDEAMGEWASSLSEHALIDVAASVADTALSCGFTGAVLFHGMLRANGLQHWKSHLLSGPYHPTYYGMLVSTVSPVESP